jgi:DNA polymerase-3 subunit alpha
LKEDGKVFVKGKVSLGEEEQGKLVCQKMEAFTEQPKEVWIRFETMDIYADQEKILLEAAHRNKGKDTLIAYIEKEKKKKIFSKEYSVNGDEGLKSELESLFGNDNIRII